MEYCLVRRVPTPSAGAQGVLGKGVIDLTSVGRTTKTRILTIHVFGVGFSGIQWAVKGKRSVCLRRLEKGNEAAIGCFGLAWVGEFWACGRWGPAARRESMQLRFSWLRSRWETLRPEAAPSCATSLVAMSDLLGRPSR